MQFTNYVSVFTLLTGCCAAVPHSKRTIQEDVTFYAYGTNISGLPLVYGNTDGLAYIATDPSSNYSSVTLDVANTGDVTWNATVANSTDARVFYIVESGFSAAGFISSNTTAPDGALTVGFSMFGSQVVYISGSNLEAQFWAQETGEDGVWALMWNTNGTSQDGSVPVALKKTAPTTITD